MIRARSVAMTSLCPLLLACDMNVPLTLVEVDRTSEAYVTITARVPSDTAREIRDKGWYFAMVVKDCGEESDRRYPMEPFVSGSPADRFEYHIGSPYVPYSGTVSSRILDEFQNPCLSIEGNNYYIINLTSSEYPLSTS